MPVSGAKPGPEKGPGGGGRTTFRPPWVKDGGQDEAKPAWVKRNAGAEGKEGTSKSTKENGKKPGPSPAPAPLSVPLPGAPVKEAKLQSREIKVPVMTQKPKPVQPALKPASKKTEAEIDKDIEKEIENQIEKEREKKFKLETPKLRHVEVNKDKTFNKSVDDITEPKLRPVLRKTPKVEESAKPPEKDVEFKDKVLKKVPEEEKNRKPDSSAPPPPPMPTLTPRPPPPPPPPTLGPPEGFEKRELTKSQQNTLEKLRSRARRRPDWSDMMKEVEGGKKLKHVECNDRSKPIITKKSITKVGEQFIYETEKANMHNQLLKQIQFGVKLRPTKCNDRSKPILEGLRKFRRQMTIEEQIQKSESRKSLNEVPPAEEESEDEMDDIDKLRDDLQSTKQLLALELRNKEAQERENKRLLSKIANLEAELEREKHRERTSGDSSGNKKSSEEVLVASLKKDADDTRKTCKELEKKYQDSAEQLDTAKGTIEEQKYQIATLEKKLAQAVQGTARSSYRPQYSFCYSYEDPGDCETYVYQGIVPSVSTRRVSEAGQKDSSPEIEMELSESESDEDEETKAARKARRLQREVKMLRCKLNRYKDKQQTAKRERRNLKEIMKKNQAILKGENKKFKKLEKEVKKMAKLMEAGDDGFSGGEDDEEKEDDDDEAEDEEEGEEEETESDDETESEESEEDSESETESESEDEDASDEDKKKNIEGRVKRYEGRLAALKKGNYLLQANVDRIQDEINKIREKSVSLQAELDSVLSELG